MRIPRSSKLDAYRDLLIGHWTAGESVAEIRRKLLEEGCKATPTTIAKWFAWKIEDGDILPRRPVMVPPPRDQWEPVSLGLLADGDEEQQSNRSKVLRILIGKDGAWEKNDLANALGENGFNLPLTDGGDPDFCRYAQLLGVRRLRTLGDTDFVLLAMWSREYRQFKFEADSEVVQWRRTIAKLIELARALRQAMYRAAGLVSGD